MLEASLIISSGSNVNAIMQKGFSAGVVIVIVALLAALGAWWYWSQGTGGADTGASDTSLNGIISDISAGSDAEAAQASAENGMESAAELDSSLNTQASYVQ